MVKRQSSSPSPAGMTGQSTVTTPSPNAASQLSMQLKQDLAMLAHKDPDTRRSSMEALKIFIEEELNLRTMSAFLEQLSGETGKSSGFYAMSLFAEVARVHKEAIVPFIPRIMAAVLRNLASSSGGAGYTNNLHQACAKVVASVARYAIEPDSNRAPSSSATDVLDSLCQPLLELLSSNVEPVAVGSATCLQAIIEADNWTLATPELIHDVCCGTTISLAEKAKHSVSHIHLARSLAKSNPAALQEYATSLLRVGVHVLVSTGENAPGYGTWQQRAGAAQLLASVIDCVDHRVLASELAFTLKALEKCRLDKMPTVRQAVGEALKAAKNINLKTDPLFIQDGQVEVNAVHSSLPCNMLNGTQKHTRHKKNGAKSEETSESILTSNNIFMNSHDSELVLYGSSPSSSITSVSTTAENSNDMTGSSLDFKENSPLHLEVEDGSALSKSTDSNYLLYSSKEKISEGLDEDELIMDSADDHVFMEEYECNKFLEEDCAEGDAFEANSSLEKDVHTKEMPKPDETTYFSPVEDKHSSDCISIGVNNQHASYHQKLPYSQAAKNYIPADNFLIFSTPRRLVRSLQSANSTPELKSSPEKNGGLELDYETLSESGWSVRDNPIAGDNDDGDVPGDLSIYSRREMITRSMELEEPATLSHNERTSELINSIQKVTRTDHMDEANGTECESLNSVCTGGSYDGFAAKQYAYQEIGLSSPLEDKGIRGSLKPGKSRSWTCASVLRKVQFCVEWFLVCTLLLVLTFTILIVFLSMKRQHDLHRLVPT
ncbi:hypothetical protein KP509_36G025800 [Ceratopteris richardii]|uniref:TORTIFOLIA1/SINE1-2 N-terminal domain-containing protein n=1 Tax=Ceratopteris richardii TaxID=49495 RepID=A0A8T2QBK5_CERRI|nr:hypothetical protein KP509_36G025800 [Ceratopteris richardii]